MKHSCLNEVISETYTHPQEVSMTMFKKKSICESPLKQRKTVAKPYVCKTNVFGAVGTYTIHYIYNE